MTSSFPLTYPIDRNYRLPHLPTSSQSTNLNTALPKRLIRRRLLLMARARIPRMLLSLLPAKSRASHALICVWCLLRQHLLSTMRALPAAAARTQQPEQSARNTKRNSKPHDAEHLAAHGGLDVEVAERGFEDTREDAVHGCGSRRSGEDEDCLCGGYDSRNQASPARKDCEETNNKLNSRQGQGDAETPDHPARHLLVRIQPILELLVPDGLLQRRVLEVPDAEGIEPEVCLAGGAVCDCFDARLFVLVAFAVGPEADLIKVFEVTGRGFLLEGLEELVVDVDFVEDVLLLAEFGCVGLRGVLALLSQCGVGKAALLTLKK